MLLVNLAKSSSSKSYESDNIYKDEDDIVSQAQEDTNAVNDEDDDLDNFDVIKRSPFSSISRRKSAITSSSEGISGTPSDVPKVSK